MSNRKERERESTEINETPDNSPIRVRHENRVIRDLLRARTPSELRQELRARLGNVLDDCENGRKSFVLTIHNLASRWPGHNPFTDTVATDIRGILTDGDAHQLGIDPPNGIEAETFATREAALRWIGTVEKWVKEMLTQIADDAAGCCYCGAPVIREAGADAVVCGKCAGKIFNRPQADLRPVRRPQLKSLAELAVLAEAWRESLMRQVVDRGPNCAFVPPVPKNQEFAAALLIDDNKPRPVWLPGPLDYLWTEMRWLRIDRIPDFPGEPTTSTAALAMLDAVIAACRPGEAKGDDGLQSGTPGGDISTVMPAYATAFQQFRRAEQELTNDKNRQAKRVELREAYEWVKDEMRIDGTIRDLPGFDTWARYVRGGRLATGQQVNRLRRGRTAGKSVVSPSEI